MLGRLIAVALAMGIVPSCLAQMTEAERLTAARKVLLEQIQAEIADYAKIDEKLKIETTMEKALEAVKPKMYGRREGTLQLHRWRDQEKVRKALVGLLDDEDGHVAFNAAQVLASEAHKEAIPALRRVLEGKAINAKGGIVATNSGYEHDRSALALLAAGQKLPKAFQWSVFAEWEKFTQREK